MTATELKTVLLAELTRANRIGKVTGVKFITPRGEFITPVKDGAFEDTPTVSGECDELLRVFCVISDNNAPIYHDSKTWIVRKCKRVFIPISEQVTTEIIFDSESELVQSSVND